ncbi:MAG: disulfide bond formation protein B [Pseudolabrys sp.]|nr:disulfide bond formation protein B [Pseudolabrys sp.]
MISDYLTQARVQPPLAAAAIVAVAGALALCTVYFFQYVLLVAPCPLCLEQRYAFYAAVPLAALLWLGASHGASRKVLILGFVVIAAIMLWNTGLATYHAGVEWKLWAGPTDCSGPIDKFGSVRDMVNQLQRISLVRCDEASWRFLGLSLAGWNVPLSLALAAVAAWGAKASFARQE